MKQLNIQELIRSLSHCVSGEKNMGAVTRYTCKAPSESRIRKLLKKKQERKDKKC